MKVSFYTKDGKMNWPAVKAFGEYCLVNAKKSTDGIEGMQLFKTIAGFRERLKCDKLEIERQINLKIQEHEIDIFRAAVFGKSYDRDDFPICMDGAIVQAGSSYATDALAVGFHLEYDSLKDIYDRVGYYDECNSFIANPTGDFRRIDITSLCRLAKDADCSKD